MQLRCQIHAKSYLSFICNSNAQYHFWKCQTNHYLLVIMRFTEPEVWAPMSLKMKIGGGGCIFCPMDTFCWQYGHLFVKLLHTSNPNNFKKSPALEFKKYLFQKCYIVVSTLSKSTLNLCTKVFFNKKSTPSQHITPKNVVHFRNIHFTDSNSQRCNDFDQTLG